MSTMSLDAKTVGPRRILRRAAVIGAVAAAAVIGLLAAESSSSNATAPKARVNADVSQFEAVPALATMKFVPSPVIDTNAQFFFGTGDGSAGYYGESPAQ